MAKFKGKSEFDIKIVSKEKVYSDAGQQFVKGLTYKPNKGGILIEISSTLAAQNSVLDVARTILHEYVHADIYRKLKTKSQAQEILDFRKTMEQYKNEQHEAIGALYLNSMRDALKAFHKEVLTNDYNKFISLFGAAPSNNYYEALAWRGLKEHEVKAFTDLSAEKVNALKKEDLKIDFSLKECPKN